MNFSMWIARYMQFFDLLSDTSRAGLDDIALAVFHKSVIEQCDRIDGEITTSSASSIAAPCHCSRHGAAWLEVLRARETK